ncbi:MAG: FHA domain-containing protein [Candidatus Riflebacteria bacterium]|nr:FHA domain-containing protein [Candidatus Riflebacteria bacterium]
MVTIVEGQQAGTSFALGQTCSLGRAPDNVVLLLDESVSGHHGSIEKRGGRYFFKDLGSVNGSYVNESMVRASTEVELVGGDRIRLGSHVVHFAFDGRPSSGPEPQLLSHAASQALTPGPDPGAVPAWPPTAPDDAILQIDPPTQAVRALTWLSVALAVPCALVVILACNAPPYTPRGVLTVLVLFVFPTAASIALVCWLDRHRQPVSYSPRMLHDPSYSPDPRTVRSIGIIRCWISGQLVRRTGTYYAVSLFLSNGTGLLVTEFLDDLAQTQASLPAFAARFPTAKLLPASMGAVEARRTMVQERDRRSARPRSASRPRIDPADPDRTEV